MLLSSRETANVTPTALPARRHRVKSLLPATALSEGRVFLSLLGLGKLNRWIRWLVGFLPVELYCCALGAEDRYVARPRALRQHLVTKSADFQGSAEAPVGSLEEGRPLCLKYSPGRQVSWLLFPALPPV